MDDLDYEQLLRLAVKAALRAGDEILKVYETDFKVDTKSDNTPVTRADKISGQCITSVLSSSGMPVISEDSSPVRSPSRSCC